MDRKYPLETLLLTRSFDSKSKVLELLESRYAINGKPTLSLKPTAEVEKVDKTTLLTKIKAKKTYQQERKKDQTKVVFKNYIKTAQFKQRLVKKKIALLKKTGKTVDVSKIREFKDLPKFEDFLKLNILWIGYVQDLLQLDLSNSERKINIQQILTKLSSADFNGCFLRVLKSENKNVVGKNGIVIWDSKNFFIIVEDRDINNPKSIGGLKLIEKKGTVFSFVIPLYDLSHEQDDIDSQDGNYLEFSIIGSRFQYRAADRSGRKFKSRNVDDLNI